MHAQEIRTFEIQDITGVAYIQKAGSVKTIRAAIGMQLQQGDRLHTEDYSTVLIQTNDTNDILTIDGGTDISIVHLTEKDGVKTTHIKVWQGNVYADVTPIANTHDIFRIESNGVLYDAQGTHFVVVIDPVTGLPTMYVGAGKVEVSPIAKQNGKNATVYPAQQIHFFPDASQDLNSSINPVDVANVVQNVSPSIIEKLLKNKQEIDKENKEILDADTPDDMEEYNPTSEIDLQRYQQNVDHALANLLKSAMENGLISEEEVNRIIEDANKTSDIPIELTKIPPILYNEKEQQKQQQIERKTEELKKQKEQEKQQRKQAESQYLNVIQQIQEQMRRLQEANRQAAEEKSKEAQDKYLSQLTEQQRQAFENRLQQQEQKKKAQEEAREQLSKPTAPVSRPPSSGGGSNNDRDDNDDDNDLPVNHDQLAAKSVIDRINNIPYPVTIAAEEQVVEARERYNALTEVQKVLVTNIEKLIASEATLEKLLKVQEVITAINEIPEDVTLANYEQIIQARLLYDGLDDDIKLQVTNLNSLIDAENKLNELLQTEFGNVFLAIENLPDEITLAEKDIVSNIRMRISDMDESSIPNISKLEAIEAQIVTLFIISEIEKNILIIQEEYNGGTTDTIHKTKLMLNSLSEEEKSKVSKESLAYFENAEVELVEDLISYLEDEFTKEQIDYARNIFNILNENQKINVRNKGILVNAEVELIGEMVNSLPTADTITLEHLQDIDYIKQTFDQFDESIKMQVDESIKLKIVELVARKESLLENELDEYINYLSNQMNEESAYSLYNIYKEYELTEDQKLTIENVFDMYIRERSFYYFYTDSLNFLNEYYVIFLSDGEKVVYIPLYTEFKTMEQLKEYFETYITDKLLISFELNEDINGLIAKAIFPNLYLDFHEIWYSEYILE